VTPVWAEPPLLTADLPGITGQIKAEPDDFIVEELPAYLPAGTGEHLFLWLEKRGLGAEFFLRQISKRLGVSTNDIGTAGLKDRHAVTRQWVSVPAAAEPRLAALEGDGIRLLQMGRHTNKLRSGHLHGNRFTIRVRGAAHLPEVVEQVLTRLRTQGLPNYYGPQRFGHGRETAELGLKLLAGQKAERRLSPFLRKLAISAGQSVIFNTYLADRQNAGLLRTVLPGDVLAKWPTGGLFTAEDVPAEQARVDAGETIPAGPIIGRKLFASHSLAAEREAAIVAQFPLADPTFADLGKLMGGTRRFNFVYPGELTATWEANPAVASGYHLLVSFTLTSGCYATVLLREILKVPVTSGDDEE
jgi:tRNA pseudouridine13 synthase